MTPERPRPIPGLRAALGRWEGLIKGRADLPEHLLRFPQVLERLFEATTTGRVPAPELLREAWEAGVPAFQHRLPDLDAAAIDRAGGSLCGLLGGANPAIQTLGTALRGASVRLSSLAGPFLAGDFDAFESHLDGVGLDGEVVASVVRLALFPGLASLVGASPIPPGEERWDGGDCPYCGRPPLLGELRGLEQRLWLRCGLCASDRPWGRLRCVGCGSTETGVLGVYHLEVPGDRLRLHACRSCGFRLNVLATLDRLTPPELLVAELETQALDAADLGPE